jgi:hypothetical protein
MKALAGLLTLGRLFFDAFVLLEYWRWFIQPLGAPAIGYAHAFGLDCCLRLLALPVVSALVVRTPDPEYDEGRAVGRSVAMWVAYAIALGVGFAVHLAMGGRA